MAHFRAVIKGQRGEASRLGSVSSGIRVSADGWNNGVSVFGHQIRDIQNKDIDVFEIYATGGSNGNPNDGYLGYVKDGTFFPADKRVR